MTTNWYIARNKQKFGPFTTHQLQQLAILGLVQFTEHVLAEGARKWVAVTSIAGIFPGALHLIHIGLAGSKPPSTRPGRSP